MGMTTIWHWVILAGVLLLLFCAGKIPKLMGDLASGIKAFKKGMKDDESAVGISSNNLALPASGNSSSNIPPGANVTVSAKRGVGGRWKFVGAVVGGALGAVILGVASLPIFGVLAVPGWMFGFHYGGVVGRMFDYIEGDT